MIRFSVIIPVYNAASSLEDTLECVAHQSFENFELLLINDGSQDDSKEIMEQFLGKSSLNARLLEQENCGLGASRNRGIEAAQGEWIAFLDADDLWHVDKLKELDHAIEQHPEVGVFYHKVYNFNHKRKWLRKASEVKSIEKLLTHSNPLVPSAVVAKRKVLLEQLFSEDRKLHGAEDLHLWVRLLASGIKFQFVESAIGYYRAEGGMSSDLTDHLYRVANALDALLESELITPKLKEQATYRKNYEAARFYQKKGNFKEASIYYRKAKSKGLKEYLLSLANALHLAL